MVRARTMMRNNRIFQSLGIGAIVSMLRKSNDGEEGSALNTDDSASAITQRESSDYNPKDDEDIDDDEVDDSVVSKNVKVQTRNFVWRGGITCFCCVLFSLSCILQFTCDLMPFSLLFIQGLEGF
jgi:hypothetical protein